jgi:hypothetical protein
VRNERLAEKVTLNCISSTCLFLRRCHKQSTATVVRCRIQAMHLFKWQDSGFFATVPRQMAGNTRYFDAALAFFDLITLSSHCLLRNAGLVQFS